MGGMIDANAAAEVSWMRGGEDALGALVRRPGIRS